MPASMSKLLDLLAVPPDKRSFRTLEIVDEDIDAHNQYWRIRASHRLEPGRALPAPAPVFPRYVEQEAAK
jgi:methionyl-tRNA synthetase